MDSPKAFGVVGSVVVGSVVVGFVVSGPRSAIEQFGGLSGVSRVGVAVLIDAAGVGDRLSRSGKVNGL